MFYHTHLFGFPLELQHFLKIRTPQEISTGHILDEVVTIDYITQIPMPNEMAVVEKEKAYTEYHFSIKYNLD